jgi:peptide-methionine (S)-S-oxide reductase
MSYGKATFGAGCFWGVESHFADLPGVVDTAAGYLGGTVSAPAYKDVCTGTTGHAEVVEVTYDPERVAYTQLLDAFFSLHNPAQPYLSNRPDRSQYRSLILAHNSQQAAEARGHIAALDASGRYPTPITTQLLIANPSDPTTTFHRAEDYHQRYYERRNITPSTVT